MNTILENTTPKEITLDIDSGIETASYEYYSGIELMKQLGRKNTGMSSNTTYMVCLGDVMTTVKPTDYPDIPRRAF